MDTPRWTLWQKTTTGPMVMGNFTSHAQLQHAMKKAYQKNPQAQLRVDEYPLDRRGKRSASPIPWNRNQLLRVMKRFQNKL